MFRTSFVKPIHLKITGDQRKFLCLTYKLRINLKYMENDQNTIMTSYAMKVGERLSNGIFSTPWFCLIVIFDMPVNAQDVIEW